MAKAAQNTWGVILMLLGGVTLAFPQLYNWLTNLTGGTAWIQIIVGILLVILGLMALGKK